MYIGPVRRRAELCFQAIVPNDVTLQEQDVETSSQLCVSSPGLESGSFGNREGRGRWFFSMGHAQGKARSKGTSLQPGVWSDKAKRMEMLVLSREEGATMTRLRHSPQGCVWILWRGWGVSHWRSASQGLVLQSGSSHFLTLSFWEPLTDSSPAGIRAALPVTHYCQRCYALTAAADGTAEEQGVSEGHQVPFTPSIISLPCWGLPDFIADKTRGIISSSVTRF